MMVNADPVEINGIYYNLVSKIKEAEVTSNPNKYTGSVTIPATVTYDGEEYSVTSIGDNAFYFCSQLTSVTIPSSVTSIGEDAFYHCGGLTSMSIPNSVTSIGFAAFSGCDGLTSVTIPNSVTALGSNAFRDCAALTSVTIPNSVTTIYTFTFKGCSSLTSVTIPNSVTTILDSNFEGCSNLSSVTIPNSVTYLGPKVFKDCIGLSSISIPNSVTEIDSWAFDGCTNLTSVTIGSGVTNLNTKAFAQCPNLADVYCYAKNVPNQYSCFENSHIEYATLHVPESSIDAYSAAAPWSNFESIVKIDMPKHTLQYMVDGESYKSYEIEEGKSITSEAAPTKEGYTFSGWSEIPEIMPANDVTVTGTFSINNYNLIYKVDGEDYKIIPTEYNSAITPEAAPTKEGYSFSGWVGVPATMPAENVTVTGTFSINNYNLIYKVDGEDYKTVPTEYNSAITPEAAPTKEGFTFSGWGEIPATMPAHDVTITGSFTKGTFKLIYNVDGQTYKTFNYDYGDDITPELAPTREGYTFSGWSEIPETMPANDVTITGTFSINNYNLIYKVDGVDYKTVPMVYNSAITPETAPTREHYTFSGWSDIPATMPANDVTITGTFSINHHNLIYNVDGEQYKLYDVNYNADITPETNPTRDGYRFTGWSEIPAKMPDEDVVVNGSFLEGEYTITYKVDGVDYKVQAYNHNAPITPEPAPTKEGYSFSGWSSIPATMPAEDITITGTFTICKYNLTYKLDGNVYQTSKVEYGTPLTPIANPSVAAYHTFSGWSEVPATMPAHDVDISGTSIPNKYKLEYQLRDPISGTYSTYKIKEVAYGSAITSEPAPTKEGCTFTNWTGEPATMPYYDVLVLGGFTANYYKLTYQVKGKAPINHSIRYGSTITPEAAPTVDGFTFNGWVDLPATMPAHDVTVNASLTKNATSNVTYPADWNLTEWSEETVSNLETDTKWYKSDYRYWYQGSCPKDESIELTANGVKIKETAGVEFAVSNCTMFEISTKAGGPYNVNIEVFQPANFFFVLKNLKRGQKVSIDFKSVDWYTDNDLFPQPVGAVKMTDSPTTRSMRTESSVAEYVVSNDGDVRFNVNADDFFYLYNVDVTAVSDVLLSYLGNPDGINNQIDCYLYWNGSSSTIYSSTINYARGADLRIENKSSQTMTITKIEMYEDKTVIGTFSDINGDLAPGNYKELSINVNSSIGMPSTLPWMKVYYTLNGVPYTKKFVSDGKGSATGINGHRVDDENGENDDIYTIDGKKLSSYPTKKGLYIKNGKKFVVK